MTNYGHKGNDLGLLYWQCKMVHETACACMWRIEDLVEGGMSFWDAKAKVIKDASPAWKGLGPQMAEGVRRVVTSYSYADMGKHIHKKHADGFLADVEAKRGKKAGWAERLLYRATGLTF